MDTILEKVEEISYSIGDLDNIEDKRDFFYNLEDALEKTGDYVKSVYDMETKAEVYRNSLEPRERAEAINKLDHSRRSKHEAMIASYLTLNNTCKLINCPPFFEHEIEMDNNGNYTYDTREKAAEFAGEVLATYYVKARDGHRLKDIVEEVTPKMQEIKEDTRDDR